MTFPTQAEETAARLHDATRDGVPLLIPGALEVRASRPLDQLFEVTTAAVPAPVPAAADKDRGRLEHEREGGGAPSQRSDRGPGILARLFHVVLYPTDLPIMWRHSFRER